MCRLIAKVVALSRDQPVTAPDNAMDTGSSINSDAPSFGESNSFLWLADVVEIMANLGLAVPACADAIHRFRSSHNT